MEKAVNAHPDKFMSASSMDLISSDLSLSPAELREKALRLTESCSGHLMFQSVFLMDTSMLLWCRWKVSLGCEAEILCWILCTPLNSLWQSPIIQRLAH